MAFKRQRGQLYFGLSGDRHRARINVAPVMLAQYARVSKAVTVQPGEEQFVTIKFAKMPNRAKVPKHTVGVLEPGTQLRLQGLLVAHALLESNGHQIISVMNAGDNPVHLDADAFVGHWVPAEVLCEDDVRQPGKMRLAEVQPAVLKKLPPHLRKLVDEAELVGDEQDSAKAKRALLAGVLHHYKDVMTAPEEPLGTTPEVKHVINTGDAAPIKQPPRRMSMQAESITREELTKLWEANCIRPSTSPWASPIVLVKKKDGTTRFCVDYRKLNSVTKKDAYPLPRIDDCFDSLRGANWFCTLDLRSGYWQIPMARESIEKTAFVTKYGLFEFLVMPFGLTNAPATFERLMERVLNGLQWTQCLVYIDDIIVFGTTFRETLEHLVNVFERLKDAKLTCKSKKCELFRRSVKFLGHVVSADGLKCDPDKVKAVAEWPVPRTVRDVRSFLGLASYYRKFIPHFADIASSLADLTKKRATFVWGDEQQEAFDYLKNALCTSPVLAYPNDEDLFILDTDASDYGIGAVLSQAPHDRPEEERVLAYASKTLSSSERKYCTTRKELLAVVTFVKQFKHFLAGKRFLLRTDHASLLWLINFKNPEGILARWLTTLSEYMPFEYMKHRPGKLHDNADALSRRPPECKKCPGTLKGCPSCDPESSFTITTKAHGNDNLVIDCKSLVAQCRLNSMVTRARKRASSEERRGEPTDKVPSIDSGYNDNQWATGWSREFLRQEQKSCPDIAKAIEWCGQKDPPDRSDFHKWSHERRAYYSMRHALCLADGILYRKVTHTFNAEPIFQVVLPSPLRKTALKYSHDHLQSGHQGENNTVAILRRRFYWPNYKSDCRSWCRACISCQKRRARYEKKAPLQQIGAGNPGDCIAMDIMGPFPVTASGNQYIMVICDVFTRWVEAYAIPNKTAETIARVLCAEYIARFGVPRRIHSDQGGEFQNRIMKGVTTLLNIYQTKTTPYRPQSDGQVERVNRTILKMLRSVVESDDANNWDEILPFLLSAYRATEHKSTGCTPNRLFLGRESHLPLDVLAPTPPREYKVYYHAEYAQGIHDIMSKAHHIARENLEKSALRTKEYYDRQSSTWKPKVGEWVWYYYPPAAKKTKLSVPWRGPYVVTKLYRDRTVMISQGPDANTRIVHYDQIKRVEGPHQQEPNWIRTQLAAQELDGNPEEIDCAMSSSDSEEEPEMVDPVAKLSTSAEHGILRRATKNGPLRLRRRLRHSVQWNEKANQYRRYEPTHITESIKDADASDTDDESESDIDCTDSEVYADTSEDEDLPYYDATDTGTHEPPLQTPKPTISAPEPDPPPSDPIDAQPPHLRHSRRNRRSPKRLIEEI